MNRVSKTYGCPVELSLTLLSGKWKPVILARLKDRPLAYGELRRLIPDLSEKVLTERLKALEEVGFIERIQDGSSSRRLRYALTARGQSLRPVLEALYAWGEDAARELDLRIRDVAV